MLTRPDRSVLLVLAALGPSDPSTWIVDDDGGPGVFTTIQGAVDAASPGDLVWVRDGTYDGFLLSKGLTIRADGSARPRIVLSAAPSVAIELVPPGERVELRGFEVSTTLFSPQHSFESLVSVSQCQGPILLADLLAIGSRGQAPIGIAYCGRVTLLRVVSRGFDAYLDPSFATLVGPSQALSCLQSRLDLVDTALVGGDGADADACVGFGCFGSYPGAPGISVGGSTLHVLRCSVLGGSGGDGVLALDHLICRAPADGGDALRVVDEYQPRESSIYFSDSVFKPGRAGSVAPACPTPTARDGRRFAAPPGTVHPLLRTNAGSPRSDPQLRQPASRER